ncbi:helix-turn-helix domain-containing protein [Variovorax saccharolyticus]|uniref:helix-turn-helix domain-containing protein n=1 Tax=Variovorax saccharolyticus TaxID=3053516 RepID=UPI002577149D|nr:helix-turn-helix domain-containing protein [Variovorax sp. J31P216]MDM0026286.1 helix-turn-helix domain-containing protein [Variovorax sp. J31P216]
MRSSNLLVVPFREVRHFMPEDSLHVESIRVRAQQHHWRIPAHRHEELHQFQLLTDGAMVGTLDGERHALRAPAALMIAPGAVHGFDYEPDSAGTQVSVPSRALASLCEHSPVVAQRLGQTRVLDAANLGGHAAECARHFSVVAEEFQSQRIGRAEALRSHVVLLALWFLRQEAAATGVGRRQALRDTLVQRYRALIERHFHEHRPLAFYAEALDVTADHLSRVCRAVASSSALALLHERVVLEARRVLVHTPMSVSEVALHLGFDDAAYFSRFFKAEVGCAPSEFRLRIAAGTQAVPARP